MNYINTQEKGMLHRERKLKISCLDHSIKVTVDGEVFQDCILADVVSASGQNQQELEAQGLQAVAVFTCGEIKG